MKENLVLWLDGQHGISRIIDQEQWSIEQKIRNIKDELSSKEQSNHPDSPDREGRQKARDQMKRKNRSRHEVLLDEIRLGYVQK